jgi:hypothetical protein
MIIWPEEITECPHQSVNPKQLCYRCIDVNDMLDACKEAVAHAELDTFAAGFKAGVAKAGETKLVLDLDNVQKALWKYNETAASPIEDCDLVAEFICAKFGQQEKQVIDRKELSKVINAVIADVWGYYQDKDLIFAEIEDAIIAKFSAPSQRVVICPLSNHPMCAANAPEERKTNG